MDVEYENNNKICNKFDFNLENLNFLYILQLKDTFFQIFNKIMKLNNIDKTEKIYLKKIFSIIKEMTFNFDINKYGKLNIALSLENMMFEIFFNYKEIYRILNFKNLKMNINEFEFKNFPDSFKGYIIYRNNFIDFIEKTKLFCNYNIHSFSTQNYLDNIVNYIEEKLNIKFNIKQKLENLHGNLKNLDEYLEEEKNSTIILDYNSRYYVKDDYKYIINIKQFFVKEMIDLTFSNLNKNINIYYNYNDISDWKITNINFINYSIEEEAEINLEFFETNVSIKNQFKYLSDIVKIIYILNKIYNIPTFYIIKMLRIYILEDCIINIYYLEKKYKDISKDLINTCGGEYSDLKEIDNNITHVIFLNNIPELFKKNNNKLLENNHNIKLINFKFILDSFYFMKRMEDIDYIIN